MKKQITKFVLAGLALVMMAGTTGCRLGSEDITLTGSLSSAQIFQVEKLKCNLPKMKVLLVNNLNLYGSSYGIDVWSSENKKVQSALEDYVKEISLAEMSRTYCMDSLAQSEGITLSQNDTDLAKQAAAEYYQSLTDAELDYMKVNQEDIQTIYENMALADAVYNHLTEGVNEEVSDDDARIIEAMQIVVSDGSRAKQVEEQLKSGSDFASVAANYNEASEIEISFGRGDLPEAVEKVAFDMEDGDISDSIKTEKGYYFLKCVNKYNQDLTDKNKIKIAESREKTAFSDVYDAYVKTLTTKLNEEKWKEVSIEEAKNLKTDSFFQIYEKYFQKDTDNSN